MRLCCFPVARSCWAVKHPQRAYSWSVDAFAPTDLNEMGFQMRPIQKEVSWCGSAATSPGRRPPSLRFAQNRALRTGFPAPRCAGRCPLRRAIHRLLPTSLSPCFLRAGALLGCGAEGPPRPTGGPPCRLSRCPTPRVCCGRAEARPSIPGLPDRRFVEGRASARPCCVPCVLRRGTRCPVQSPGDASVAASRVFGFMTAEVTLLRERNPARSPCCLHLESVL